MSNSVFRLVDLTSQAGFGLWKAVFDLPGEKVNKLDRRVMDEFATLIPQLEEMAKNKKLEALLLVSGKPGNFVAGADITLIQAAKTAQEATELSRTGQKLLDRFEDLPFVKIAAVNGSCLGGGLELALGCDAIVVSNDPATKLGLPEVLLGVLPGMGGCSRLPRKVGVAQALDMALTGKQLNGERAFKAGLADGLVAKEDFENYALRWVISNWKKLKAGERLAKEPALGGMGGPVGKALESNPLGRAVIFKKAREGVMKQTRGQYPAPLEIIEVIKSNGAGYGVKLKGSAREEAMEREATGFGKLAATAVSKSLIRIFFMTEAVKKSSGVTSRPDLKVKPAQVAGVLGAGVMGGGIAQLFAEKEIQVRMKDLNNAALALGIQSTNKVFKSKLKKRRMSQREFLQKLSHITPVTDFAGFASTDVVVEAIVEKMEVKKAVLADLEKQVSDSCVIASNTSSLSITEMQKALKKPERFAGMHFFNPVHKMPLVEVIRGEKTSDEAAATVYQLSRAIGKTPIVVKDAPGFLVNRLLAPYLNEAVWLLAEGAPIEEIDDALLEFGMPMGPMELIDEVGIDVGEKVAHILHDAFGDRMQPATQNAKLVETGRLGKKSKKGLYLYEGGERLKRVNDPEVYNIIGVSPVPGKVSKEEMVERCILPIINEAARCLVEKVVETPDDVDLGMIFGTGFAPFRGGPLRYADSLGVRKVVELLKKYEKRFGARYAPAPQLLEMAEKNQPFHASV